jgi:hypothetical protein
MHVDLPFTGGCVCGRVRYESRSRPLSVSICHCKTCQARTGSAFSMTMPVPREGFALTRGATITRDLPGGSGAIHTQHFCEHCLSRLYTEPRAHPGIVYLRPGTLDDTSWIKPVAQIWTQSEQPWAHVEGLQAFEQAPADWSELIEAYRAQ